MTDLPNLPPITDHAFMREVRRHCEDMSRSMEQIAADLGCDVDHLVRWIMLYREPRNKTARPLDYYKKDGPPITFDGRAIRTDSDLYSAAQRFKNWQRSHSGAAKTLARTK
jgi:hypothetical protein